MRVFFLMLIILSTCLSFELRAQKYGLDSITSAYNAWRNTTLQEKIFLHTDRSSYLTGETIWLKAFRFDATSHHTLDWSKILYIELLDKSMVPVLQTRLALNENGGDGSIFLPASLATGNYILRAYTNWMKNSGSEFFFNQAITVVNPFLPLEELPAETVSKYDVQFFPEGGNLVYDLESVVGIRAVNKNGQGIEFKGVIINENNDTVSRFTASHAGLSKCVFKPQTTHVYTAIIEDNNNTKFRYSLPLPEVAGYVMHLKDSADKLIITVNAKNVSSTEVYLLAHTRQMLKLQQRMVMRNGKGEAIINKRLLSAGVSSFTVFNEQLQPVCERLYFIQPEKKSVIKLNGNPYLAKPREKVDLDIIVEAPESSRTAATSIAVFRVDSLELPVQNIVEYTWLTSDLSGTVEDAGYYFGNETDELKNNTDNLLLTHGWRRFDWKDIFSTKTSYSYPPEINGHLIRGKVTEIATGKSADQVPVYLSFMGTPVNVYVSVSNKGDVLFETESFAGSRSMIVQTDSNTDNQYRIEIEDSFHDKGSYSLQPFVINRKQASQLRQRSIHMQVQNVFYEDDMATQPKTILKTFYGKPDETYQLDDYTRFPTLEEVMREYVPGIRVKKRGTEFSLSNIDLLNRVAFANEPLVLVDGVPVLDINKLMEIDPLNLKQLDVVKRRYYLNDMSFDGIVSYISYKGDLAGFRPPERALLINYKGTEVKREFFSPRYDLKNDQSKMPDARHVLYWSVADLKDFKKHWLIDFFTSDIAGQYKIVVQALTNDGQPAYTEATFIVR